MNGKPIKLTAQEVEGLEQVVSAGHKWIDGSNPAYPGLILKIGGAFLEAIGRGGHQELYLSEQEAWYLREMVPANMRVRGETVGQSLKRKLYPILLEFEAERYSEAALTRYGSSKVEEPLTREDVFRQDAGPEESPAPDDAAVLHQPQAQATDGHVSSNEGADKTGEQEEMDSDGQPAIDQELSDTRDGAELTGDQTQE
ncbi:MAG: hypothetical protein J4F43_02115 [Dehalococcoidia bacterium]|nr:hypothetical protein [Dehalococcoidia bacterium]